MALKAEPEGHLWYFGYPHPMGVDAQSRGLLPLHGGRGGLPAEADEDVRAAARVYSKTRIVPWYDRLL